ncbi:hypothetical protein LUCX_67 [Xanthomonas phage vB_XciM_LucasX]|nr:hypothetical protein LUCX_67 [Xanthomonas phage vB_XciM_LucasX]
MSEPVVPSLSLAGFVTDIRTQIDKLFSYYLTSDYSQTTIFTGQVLSLQKHIQEFQHDNSQLTERVRADLSSYLGSISDDVTVRVSTDIPNPDDPNRTNLTIEALVVKDGVTYSVGKLIEVQDTTISKIIEFNNKGLVT